MPENIGLLAAKLFEMYSGLIIVLLVLALIFSLLTIFASQACDPSRRWWQNPELPTDICYALGTTFLSNWHLLGLPAMALLYGCLSGFMTPAEIKDYIANGRGPLSGIGFWWQDHTHTPASRRASTESYASWPQKRAAREDRRRPRCLLVEP